MYPTDAVAYEVGIVVLGGATSQEQTHLYMLITNELLIPAVSNLPGYHSVSSIID